MKTTTNFNLNKPDQTDNYNVDDFNKNADIMDTEMKTHKDALKTLKDNFDNLFEVVHTW